MATLKEKLEMKKERIELRSSAKKLEIKEKKEEIKQKLEQTEAAAQIKKTKEKILIKKDSLGDSKDQVKAKIKQQFKTSADIEALENLVIEFKYDEPVFGVDIPAVMNYPSHKNLQVPQVFTDCLLALEGASFEEGLFRISANVEKVSNIKHSYDLSQIVSFQNIDFHTIACLLKLYFRLLPTALFPTEVYNDLIDTEGASTEEIQISEIKIIISKLNETNKLMCNQLFGFLHKISLNSDINKMTPENLSTCWAPNLMQIPVAEDMQFFQDSQKINHLVSVMIKHNFYI